MMKHSRKKFVALLLAVLVAVSIAIPVSASEDAREEDTRASAYITSYFAHCSWNGSTIDIYFDITGTGTMDSIGVTAIAIYDSHNSLAAILDSSNTTGLMGYNTGYYQNTINWNGAVSTEDYYAIVFFKSAKGGGYDTAGYLTPFA